MRRPVVWLPLVVAAALTLRNAAKPVVVDDTAYLLRARYIAQHPLDPYSGTLFWSFSPQPAMDILVPPVLPYWLALGMGWLGENILLLKVWLFPFAWLLSFSTFVLLRRFTRGRESAGLLFLAAAVLPLFNFMLDLPALSFGTAALALFLRRGRRGIWWSALLAGALAALAMQTKYTMLVVPAVLAWAGLLTRRIFLAMLAIAVALVLFIGWEMLMKEHYGRSHFLVHSSGELSLENGGEPQHMQAKASAFLEKRSALVVPLLAQFGGLGFGLVIWLFWLLVSRRSLFALFLALSALPLAALLFLPGSDTNLFSDLQGIYFVLNLSTLYYGAAGALLLALLSYGSCLILWHRRIGRLRRSWVPTVFLLGWLLMEAGSCLVLSPFPAARRVVGVELVAVLLAARIVSRLARVDVSRKMGHAVLVVCLLPGLIVAVVDFWDAWPEKVLAEQAAALARPAPGETVWYRGHWGFQWYAEQAGMRPIIVNETTLRAGDWLVYPYTPDTLDFYRPWHGGWDFPIDEDRVEWQGDLVWLDGLSGQTIPPLYGGSVPLSGRNHPRLRVGVFRILTDWVPAP